MDVTKSDGFGSADEDHDPIAIISNPNIMVNVINAKQGMDAHYMSFVDTSARVTPVPAITSNYHNPVVDERTIKREYQKFNMAQQKKSFHLK